jgi:hypothetical protein
MKGGFFVFVALFPVWFTSQPASVSSAVQRFHESLIELRLQPGGMQFTTDIEFMGRSTGFPDAVPACVWVDQQMRIKLLHDALSSANGGQGIGFRVGPVVVNLQRLFAGLGSLLTVLVAVCKLALELGDQHVNKFVVGVHHQCPYEWTAVEGNKCFKLFAAERATWPAAEVTCQAHSGHLVSITSYNHQDAVVSLIQAASLSAAAVWIGLHAEAAQGERHTFAWTDGAPMKFKHWKPGEHGTGSNCPGYSKHACGFVFGRHSRWYGGNCDATDFEPQNQVDSLPGNSECYPAYQPFICSREPLPSKSSIVARVVFLVDYTFVRAQMLQLVET